MALEWTLQSSSRRGRWWYRLGRWWWVLALPAAALGLFVAFLAITRIGNEGAPRDESWRVPPKVIYLEQPELYFDIWQADTPADQRQMLALWRQELSRLQLLIVADADTVLAEGFTDLAHIELRIAALEHAIGRLESALEAPPR